MVGLLWNDRPRLEARLREIPPEPGVYLMRDRLGEFLYIGKSKQLRSRVRSYFRAGEDERPRIALMLRRVAEIEFIVTDTEAEALALEANLIKQHQPPYNVLLKDDKRYPYLCITWSEAYPRLFITRKRRPRAIQDRYYGPFVDSRALRHTLRTIQRVFPLRQRPQPLFKDRPCLNYDLGHCPGVCQAKITPEAYRQTVQRVAMIFQGRVGELVESLTAQMAAAAAQLQFEQAAQLRDQIRAIQGLTADQKVNLPDDRLSQDAIGVAQDDRHGAVQLFQVRGGKLVGRLGFLVEWPATVPPSNRLAATGGPYQVQDGRGAMLQRLLEEHYSQVDPVEIPQEILLPHPLPDPALLQQWLSDRKGSKVTLTLPQRQGKADLVQMVTRNAQYELERNQKFAQQNLQALEEVAAILDLPELPRRIEGYDISHFHGSQPVASQVVFIDGIAAPQHYRRYHIKNDQVRPGHSDDFASLAEVLRRRGRRYKDNGEDRPDLIMIDGGKGQLSAVVRVWQELDLMGDIPLVSLAKQREELFIPGEQAPLETEPDQPGVQLLRRLRDEAHRFALTFHRQERMKASRRSQLEAIPGLGFERQKRLLGHFASLDNLRLATPQQLQTVPGIGPQLAQAIYDYFHPDAAMESFCNASPNPQNRQQTQDAMGQGRSLR